MSAGATWYPLHNIEQMNKNEAPGEFGHLVTWLSLFPKRTRKTLMSAQTTVVIYSYLQAVNNKQVRIFVDDNFISGMNPPDALSGLLFLRR